MKIKTIEKAILFLALCCCLLPAATIMATPTVPPLSLQAQISLLTSTPFDDEIYALYGHTAVRVYDPETPRDIVFNYGIFDFSKPNFIYRFAKGETDYMLRAYSFYHYLAEYIDRGSEVCEQTLNLLPDEKEALWQALAFNERPENSVYRYNFFFDNCATRPAAVIERYIRGIVAYATPEKTYTFREVINHCTRRHPWATFGCDLVLGAPTDRIMTFKETFFLPQFLKEAFDGAQIIRDGITQPLVSQTRILAEEQPKPDTNGNPFTPFVCCCLLLAVVLTLTWCEWRNASFVPFASCIGKAFDVILFLTAGIAGCVLFFLSFVSVHPSIYPNISLLWLHPFHFAGIVFFVIKKYRKLALGYNILNCAIILGVAVAWIFVQQHFNIAFAPLMASLWLRSAWALYQNKCRIL